MRSLRPLFDSNRRWSEEITARDPEFFGKLVGQQSPDYLWIGCADSRVPANEIVGLLPGELFVHRNVANVVPNTDMNAHAVIQYAVDHLKVEHIVVCGHYRCGGVHAAMGSPGEGALAGWLSPLRELRQREADCLSELEDEEQRWNRLCELNVIEQVRQLAALPLIGQAWDEGQRLSLHGWMYQFHTGLLHDLGTSTSGPDDPLPA